MGNKGDNKVLNIINENNKDIIPNPTLIAELKDKKIKRIEAGAVHSFAQTESNEFYLWGSNTNNECLTDKNANYVKFPTLVFQDKYKKISDIFWETKSLKLFIQYLAKNIHLK